MNLLKWTRNIFLKNLSVTFLFIIIYFNYRYSYALRGTVKKTNEKRLNCRVDIRFADELQSIKVNVKNQEWKWILIILEESFCHFFYSLLIYFYCRYSYALRGTVKKTNEKRLVFDFQRSKLVSVIQCFKSFATQTVKHFNHDFQLFDTRLQIIWHFLQPFS